MDAGKQIEPVQMKRVFSGKAGLPMDFVQTAAT